MFSPQPVCRRGQLYAALSNICQHNNHAVLSEIIKAKNIR